MATQTNPNSRKFRSLFRKEKFLLRKAVVAMVKQPMVEQRIPVILHCHPLPIIWETRLVPIRKAHPNQESTLGLTFFFIVLSKYMTCALPITIPANKPMYFSTLCIQNGYVNHADRI